MGQDERIGKPNNCKIIGNETKWSVNI